MNPSTDDMLKAIMATPAEVVFVLPNNKNIFLAAKAAAESLAAGTYANAEELNNAINALEIYAGAATKKACSENKNVLFTNITNEKVAAWLTEEGRAAGDAPEAGSESDNGVEQNPDQE